LLRKRKSASLDAPDDLPLVIVEKTNNALRLVSADPAALDLGIGAGLTLGDARVRVPALAVAEANPAADLAQLERLADWCERYTPLVALDPPGGLVLDITGCAHLFGGEASMRGDLCIRIEEFGFKTRAAIAGTPDTARALALFSNLAVVPTGGDAAAVRPLPIGALGISPDVVTRLARAGLKTIADVADRPRAPLVARFGEELLARLERALGQEDIRITPRRPLPICMSERRFSEPITNADYIRSILRRLAIDAARILELRGEGGRHFEASFFRADGELRRIAVDTAMPQRDPDVVTALFERRLESLVDPLDPGFGFDLIRLTVVTAETLVATQNAFDREDRKEEASALTDRLGAQFGPASVLHFMPRNTHIPERAARNTLIAMNAETSLEWHSIVAGEPPARPLYLFNPPQPIETLAEVPDGPPLRFRWRRVLHEVTLAEGPERISPEWWQSTDDELTRDYFRIEDSRGRRFWVFRHGLYERDTASPRWFIHGLFA
jgi:protein ImuB